jgi:hypothetical protein
MKLIMKFYNKLHKLAKKAQSSTAVTVKSPGKKDVPVPKKPKAKTTAKPKTASFGKKNPGKKNSKSQLKSKKAGSKKARRLEENFTERILQAKSAKPITSKAAPALGVKPVTNKPAKVEKKLNKNGKIEVNTSTADSIKRVIAKDYKKEEFKIWKKHAARCYDRLDLLLKGYMCSFCSAEVNVRWSNKNHVKISPKDAAKWSTECGAYIEADYKLLSYVQDAQTVLQSLPGKTTSYPKAHKALPTTAQFTEIITAVKACSKSEKTCGPAMKLLTRVMAISNITRFDHDYFKVVKDMASRVLNWSETKPVVTKDKKIATPAVKTSKKMRRLIASIAKKEKEPFQAICQLPYKHTIKLDGKNKTSIIYSPDYQISIDAKLKYPVYKFDTKLKSKKVKGLPMPPKRLNLTRPGTGDQTCSRASGFGLESTSKIRPRSPGASRFCPNIKNFCCKPHAMRKFVWAWDKHQTGYAVNIKQCGESPLYLTQYMVKWMLNTGLKRDSMTRNSKWCRKSANNLTICKGIFNDLIKKRREMMKDGGLDNYTGDYIACSRTINKFKTSAMCMACDADVQKFFNKTDKTIPVKSDYLNRLVRRCYTAKAFESNKLAPFYATLLKYSDVVRRDPTFVEIGNLNFFNLKL